MINGESMEITMIAAFFYLVLMIIGTCFVYGHMEWLSASRNFCCRSLSVVLI